MAGAGLSAGPPKFISLCSLLLAVGEDSEIWKWYAIKKEKINRIYVNYLGLGRKSFLL